MFSYISASLRVRSSQVRLLFKDSCSTSSDAGSRVRDAVSGPTFRARTEDLQVIECGLTQLEPEEGGSESLMQPASPGASPGSEVARSSSVAATVLEKERARSVARRKIRVARKSYAAGIPPDEEKE